MACVLQPKFDFFASRQLIVINNFRGSSSKGQNCPPTPSLIRLDTLPPLACLHCAATQATVLRDRQILDARAGYPTQCVCCDCETGSACPKCRGEHLEYGPVDDPSQSFRHD